MGLESIELLGEKDWATVQKFGLKSAVGYATDYGIPKGFNRIANHEKLIADYTAMIPKAAAAGIPNLICFSGNREGQNDNVGIMEGNVIDTIKINIKYIGHVHTGGVSGRHELDDTQELYYPAIMKALVATGHKGFVGQEFTPTWPDKLDSLHKSVLICDV